MTASERGFVVVLKNASGSLGTKKIKTQQDEMRKGAPCGSWQGVVLRTVQGELLGETGVSDSRIEVGHVQHKNSLKMGYPHDLRTEKIGPKHGKLKKQKLPWPLKLSPSNPPSRNSRE